MRLSAIKDLIDRMLILQEFKKLQEKVLLSRIISSMIEFRPLFARSLEETGQPLCALWQVKAKTLTQFKEIRRRKDCYPGDASAEGR